MQTVALGHPEPAVVPTLTADVAIEELGSSPNQECSVINKMVSGLERLWSYSILPHDLGFAHG
jgi:hypothetical protein